MRGREKCMKNVEGNGLHRDKIGVSLQLKELSERFKLSFIYILYFLYLFFNNSAH